MLLLVFVVRHGGPVATPKGTLCIQLQPEWRTPKCLYVICWAENRSDVSGAQSGFSNVNQYVCVEEGCLVATVNHKDTEILNG